MPRAGNGHQPSVSPPERGICTSAATASEPAGSAVLPLPRSALAKVLASHTSTAPANSTSEYASAWARSEERRVGKECRSRWWPDHEKKKENRNRSSSAGSQVRCSQDRRRQPERGE